MKVSCNILKVLSTMAQRNVVRNWRHSLAAMVTIAIGFTAIALFDAFMAKVDDQFYDDVSKTRMYGDVVIQGKGGDFSNFRNTDWKYYLDNESQAVVENFLSQDAHVLNRMRFLKVSGNAQKDRASDFFFGMGIDLKEGAAIRGARGEWDAVAGIPLHMNNAPRTIAIGKMMGKNFACSYQGPESYLRRDGTFVAERRPFECQGQPLSLNVTTERGKINSIRAPVTALVDSGIEFIDKHYVMMSLTDAQKLMVTDRVTAYMVKLKSADQAADFISRFNRFAVTNGRGDLVASRSVDSGIGQAIFTLINLGHSVKYFFLVVIIVLAGMTVSNTMRKSVRERVSEIGTLRSLGFFQRYVVWLFSLESLMLGVLSIVCGILLTSLLMAVGTVLGFTMPGGIMTKPLVVGFLPTPGPWLINALAFITLAAFTGWRASRIYSRMVIADALHSID